MKRIWIAGLLLGLAAVPAGAAETTYYAYDARGRLVAVDKFDGPAPANTTYRFDKASNRTSKTVIRPEVQVRHEDSNSAL